MTNLEDRVKSVNIDHVDAEQVEVLGEQLGKKLGDIGDAAAAEMNKIASIYGLKAKVLIQLFDASTGEILKG